MGHESAQKAHERECLERTLRVGRKRCFGEGDLLKYFAYDDVPGVDCECPDFIKVGIDHDRRIFVGIEHFDVDMMSYMEKKNKEAGYVINSVTAELERYRDIPDISVFGGRQDRKVVIPGTLDIGRVFDWVKHRHSLQFEQLCVSCHRLLLRSYEAGIKKHINKKKAYKNTIRTVMKDMNCESCRMKLFWLINVSVRPYRMMIANGTVAIPQLIYPLTLDVLKLLKESAARDLSGIVLCVRDPVENDDEHVNVFCLSANALCNNLSCSDVPVCVYAGPDADYIDAYHVREWESFRTENDLVSRVIVRGKQTLDVAYIKGICETFSDRGRYLFLVVYDYIKYIRSHPERTVCPLFVNIDLYCFAELIYSQMSAWISNMSGLIRWAEDDELYFVDKLFCRMGMLVCENLSAKGISLPTVYDELKQVLLEYEAEKQQFGKSWKFPEFGMMYNGCIGLSIVVQGDKGHDS